MASAAVAVHHDSIRQPSANPRTAVTPPPQITSATLFRRSRQPACLVATNDAASDKQDVAGIDSGYATAESAAPSPEGKDPVKSEGSIASDKLVIQERRFFQRKVTRLREFDKTIPTVFHNRFADLCELLGKPLYDYLVKANVKYKGIGMKLKALGESEASAKPWIVVLCDPAILKRVKRFFQEPWVKAECQPHNADLPYFDIYFHNQAPKQHAGSSQLGVHQNPLSTKSNPETLCGRAIMINHPNGFRAATLGGRIMVLNADGGLQAYALTAGHISSDTGSTREDHDMEPSEDEDDSCGRCVEDESDSDSEIFELDLVHEGETDIQAESGLHVQLPRITLQSDGQDQSLPELWPKLGHIHATSCAEDTANLDWALVTIDRLHNHLPNRMKDSSKIHSFWANISVPPKQKLASDRSVVVITGPGYPQRHGRLSDSTSFVMLRPGNQFVPVYDLKFEDGSALKPGDCGAWAIDSSTDEVYGHVVASDVFEEAYVIPLGATFKDIKHQLGAEAVYMPREHEPPNLPWEQGLVESSTSATISPSSDSFLEALSTDATDLTDFSLFEPFHRSGKDQSSTSTSPKRQDHDNMQQSWKWWEHSSNRFETSKMSPDIPDSDIDKPLPDSGYASKETSGPNSPESPLTEPPAVSFKPNDGLSPAYSFDATDRYSNSQLFIPTNNQGLPGNIPQPPTHLPFDYPEYPALVPTHQSLPARFPSATSHYLSTEEAYLSIKPLTRERSNRRGKIRSWFRRYFARKEDGLRDRLTSHG